MHFSLWEKVAEGRMRDDRQSIEIPANASPHPIPLPKGEGVRCDTSVFSPLLEVRGKLQYHAPLFPAATIDELCLTRGLCPLLENLAERSWQFLNGALHVPAPGLAKVTTRLSP